MRGRIRAALLLGGFHITRISPNVCQVISVSQVDLNGWLPLSAMSALGVNSPLCLGQANVCLTRHQVRATLLRVAVIRLRYGHIDVLYDASDPPYIENIVQCPHYLVV